MEHGNPLVSVVIPAYNRAALLPLAIDSVLAQTYRPIEVIVVDDGSTDCTPDVVRGYGAALRSIRQINGGPSRARNTGIRASHGELIAFLDSDDLWLPQKLSLQVDLLLREPTVGAVDCSVYGMTGDGTVFSRQIRGGGCSGDGLERMLLKNRCSPSCIVVRAECFRRVGLFDETLKLSEDWDMWLRIANEFPIAWLTTPLVKYRCHPGNLSLNIESMKGYMIRVLQNHLSPGVRFTIRRKAWAHVYWHTGIEYLEQGRRRTAAWNFMLALRHWPFERIAVVGLLRATLGEQAFHRLIAWRPRATEDEGAERSKTDVVFATPHPKR